MRLRPSAAAPVRRPVARMRLRRLARRTVTSRVVQSRVPGLLHLLLQLVAEQSRPVTRPKPVRPIAISHAAQRRMPSPVAVQAICSRLYATAFGFLAQAAKQTNLTNSGIASVPYKRRVVPLSYCVEGISMPATAPITEGGSLGLVITSTCGYIGDLNTYVFSWSLQ